MNVYRVMNSEMDNEGTYTDRGLAMSHAEELSTMRHSGTAYVTKDGLAFAVVDRGEVTWS